MVNDVKVTTVIARVLRVFLADPEATHFGMELMRTTGLPSGTLYPALTRLERAEWLLAEREDIDPAVEGRPPRKYLRLNPVVVGRARCAIAELSEQIRLTDAGPTGNFGTRLRPAPGGGHA